MRQAAHGPLLRQGRQYTWLQREGPIAGRTAQPRHPAAKPSAMPLDPPREWALPEPDRPQQDPAAAATASTTPSLVGTKELEADPGRGTAWVPARPHQTFLQDTTDYYGEPERRWNAKAIAAAPAGLATVLAGLLAHSIPLLLIGGAIAFALGLIGSRQCRDRGDRGKGLALVGMILGAFALFFGLMVLILAG